MKNGTALSRTSWILVVLSVGILTSCRTVFLDTPQSLTTSRQVITNDLGWQEIWRRSIRLSYDDDGDPTATIAGSKIVVAVEERPGQVFLSALDAQKGQTVWTHELGLRYGFVDSITADDTQIYLAAAFAVQSFQVADGQSLWSTSELATHLNHELLPIEQMGIIRDQAGDSHTGITTFSIDTLDGTVKSAVTSSQELKAKTDTATYYVTNSYDLTSVDSQSGQTHWSIKIGTSRGHPILVDPQVLVFQEGDFLTSLVGVDPTSGRKLWETKQSNIVSNFIAIGGIVYAITTESAIIAIDVTSGRIVGQMAFSSGPLDVEHSPEYWLLTQDSKVFAYFHDSQELLAFERR